MVTVTLRACGLSRAPSQSAQRITLHVLFELPPLHLALACCDSCDSSSGMMPSKWPPYFVPAAPLRQVNVMCSSPVPHSQSCCSSGSSSSPRRFEHRARASRPCLRSIVSATP